MQLKHIELNQLKTTALNVRKIGGKEVDDLLPSIRSLGILQPLLVRPNCEGFEIVAGQRRYNALVRLAEEQAVEPVPCIVMDNGDDAKAIEASLAENIARLPMDEVDQYKAFAALSAKGLDAADIASQFGVTERLVRQRMAVANLIGPVLTLYRKNEIRADTVRILTLATKRQQQEWVRLFKSEDDYAPHGRALKDWLFGGAHIPVSNALFDLSLYEGAIVSDLFGEDQYFADTKKFWPLQNEAIAAAKEKYLAAGWKEVVILEAGQHWPQWEHRARSKSKGGRVYVEIAANGEVSFHEGFVTSKEAEKQGGKPSEDAPKKAERPELTKAMQNYLALHRHAAVRTKLLGHPGVALRLCVAQIVAGSSLFQCRAEPQKAATEQIAESLEANKTMESFNAERKGVRELIGWEEDGDETLVSLRPDWQQEDRFDALLVRLLELDDEAVMRVFTFAVSETLPSASGAVEILGAQLSVDMGEVWEPDAVFLDLLRDKEAINAILSEVGGKQAADAHVASTAKVQKGVIAQYLDGTRQPQQENWLPRYMRFPMEAYTGRGGIEAIEQYHEALQPSE